MRAAFDDAEAGWEEEEPDLFDESLATELGRHPCDEPAEEEEDVHSKRFPDSGPTREQVRDEQQRQLAAAHSEIAKQREGWKQAHFIVVAELSQQMVRQLCLSAATALQRWFRNRDPERCREAFALKTAFL